MRTATLDLNSRGSFVDDLNSKPGIVMCRDALLHRSHEIQPAFFGFGRKKSNFFAFFSFFLFFPSPGTWTWHRNSAAPPHARVRERMVQVRGLSAFFLACTVGTGRSARAYNGNSAGGRFKTCGQTLLKHTFSAFWLRSSVVSVLISLISGTWRMASHEFK